MYQRRFLSVCVIAALVILFNAVLVSYPLPGILLITCITVLLLGAMELLLRVPMASYASLRGAGLKMLRHLLEDDRAPHLLLSFFLLAFSSAQAMITTRQLTSALGYLSLRFTGNETLIWVVIIVTAAIGVAVYVLREKPLFFYTGIVCVLLYVGVVLLEMTTGKVSSLGLLAILYLLYGCGGNLLTVLAYHYHQRTRLELDTTRTDLQMAQSLIAKQQGELEALRHEILDTRRRLYEHPG